jgi:DNA polymerase/3'-5' exonuclease PolX
MKTRFPLPVAAAVADHLVGQLSVACLRIVTAGSIRRAKPDVGDIELLYIPRVEPAKNPADFFGAMDINLADHAIADLESRHLLARRLNARGHTTFGPSNKLMVHVPSGIPVDLFTARRENWFNLLVCRTGPAESNMRIAQAAIGRGWRWNPYGPGFTRPGGEEHPCTSEEDVFNFVGLRYLEPQARR